MLAKNHIHPDRTCFSKCAFCSIRFGLLDVPFHGHEFRSDVMKEYLISNYHKLDDCMCEYCKGCFKKRYDDEQSEKLKLKDPKQVSNCEMENCIKKAQETMPLTNAVKVQVKKEGTNLPASAKAIQVCRLHHDKLKGQKCLLCCKFFEPVLKRPPKYDLKEYNTEIAKEKPGVTIELETDMCRMCQMVLTQKITKLKKAKVMKSLTVSRVGRRIEKSRPKLIRTRSQITGRHENTQPQKNPAAHSSRSCNKECQLCYIKFGEYDIPLHAAEYQEAGLQQHYKDTYKKPLDLCLCRKCFTKIAAQYKTGTSPDSGNPATLFKIRKLNCIGQGCKEPGDRYIRVKPQLLQMLQQQSAVWESKIDKSPSNKPQRVNLCVQHFNSFKLALMSQQKCHICNTALNHNSLFAPFRRNIIVVGKMAGHINSLLRSDGRPERIMKDSKLCRHCYMYWTRRSKGAGMPSPVNKYLMHKRYSFSYEENDLPCSEGLLSPDAIKQEPHEMMMMQNMNNRFSSHVASHTLPPRSTTVREMDLKVETKMKFYSYVRDYPSESAFIEHLLSLEDERRRTLNLDVYTGRPSIKTEEECQSRSGDENRVPDSEVPSHSGSRDEIPKTKLSKDSLRMGNSSKASNIEDRSKSKNRKKLLTEQQFNRLLKSPKHNRSLVKPGKLIKPEKRNNLLKSGRGTVSPKVQLPKKTNSENHNISVKSENCSVKSEDLSNGVGHGNNALKSGDSNKASKLDVSNKVPKSGDSSKAPKPGNLSKSLKSGDGNKTVSSSVCNDSSKTEECNKTSTSGDCGNSSKSENRKNVAKSDDSSKSETIKDSSKPKVCRKMTKPRISKDPSTDKRKVKCSKSNTGNGLSEKKDNLDSSKSEDCKVADKTTEEESETQGRRRRAAKKVTNYTENDEVFESFFLSAESSFGQWFESEDQSEHQFKEENQVESSSEVKHSTQHFSDVAAATKKLFIDDDEDVSPAEPSIIKLKH